MVGTDSADGTLTFGVLGPLEAKLSAAPLPLGGRQQRAVLARLLCSAGRVVSVDKLVEAVWEGHPPPGAVTSVQTYVFHLRQILEPDRRRGSAATILVTAPGGYRLDVTPQQVDLTRFEELIGAADALLARGAPDRAVATYDTALSLWRGEVLADLTDRNFVAPLRARLEETRLAALQSRIQAKLDLGRDLGVVGELGGLIAQHPLREGFHAQRILALYRSGRQSDALAAYRELHAVLDTELGIEPSPPLQELNNQVLKQDPTLAWQPPPSNSSLVVPARSPAPRREPTARHSVVRVTALVTIAAAVAVLVSGADIPAQDRTPTAPIAPANAVSEIDASGSIVGSVPVGTNPTALVSTPDTIWVVNASDDTVSRIDTATHTVRQELDVGHDPRALVLTGDDLWVTNFGDGTVTRINVVANKVIDTIRVGSDPDAIASGPAGLWVANSGDNTIQRLYPATGAAGVALQVGDGPDGLVVDDTSVWVANGREGSVMRVGATTGEQVTAPIRVGSGPRGILRVGQDVWVADELSETVTRINIATSHTHSIDVGDGPTAIAAVGGAIWVAERYSGDLIRIDLDTEDPHRVKMGAPVNDVTIVDGRRLWVAAGAFASAAHRGGTLRVAAASLPGTESRIDPARVYDRTTLHAIRVVYDGLLAYHYASADPQTLVPDLATAVPEPTNNGRTYTFNLRPGLRYSTGTAVRASDFKRGVHRALLATDGRPDFYFGIRGGRACTKHPGACDLSRGVVTDNASGRVTFHLEARDPQFLYKLTLLVVPAPPGAPLREATRPLPGTGPYKISGYAWNKRFTLARNPYFHQWSAAAQPAGFLDEMTWIKVADTHAAASAVQRGRADLAELTPLGEEGADVGALVERLRIATPAQLHRSVAQATSFGIINGSRSPFNRTKARQAFNFAVDRRKVVQLLGGPSVAIATCQLFPPGMPSYRPYCPYTRGAQDGGYHGPDLHRARELVSASGTTGMKVNVTDVVGDYNPPVSAYLARVLRSLGYDVTFQELPDTLQSADQYYDPESGINVETGGWIADFPLPSNFYELVACGGGGGYPVANCNKNLDRQAKAANLLLQNDPAAALRRWTSIERKLTNLAPLVPLTNNVDWWLTSKDVGNYQVSHQEVGPLLSQLWIR